MRARAVVVVSFFTATAMATDIWMTGGGLLYRFDSQNPGTTFYIGFVGKSFQGMDFGPDGILYGYCSDGLYQIDPNNAHTTRISGPDPSVNILDLAWNPADQRMYAISNFQVQSPPALYTIDLSTGSSTLVGVLDIPTPAATLTMAANAAGVLFVEDVYKNGIYRLDGLHGVFLGPEGFKHGIDDEGMTVDWSRTDTMYHAARDLDTGKVELWTVDQSTGVGTLVGQIGNGNNYVNDIAMMPIPEPTSGAALLLMVICRTTRSRRSADL